MNYRRTVSSVNRYLCASLMCALLVSSGIVLPPQAHSEDNFQLTMGYSPGIYQTAPGKDIMAAVSVLMKKISWKYFGKSEARYYDNMSEMAADLKSGTLDVACLPPEEFIYLRNRAPLEPVLVTSTSNGHEAELLLLTRSDSGIHAIGELRNRSIVMPQSPSGSNSMFRVWVETMLMRAGHRNIASFFSTVKETQTASRAVMPVFFRQAAACVVTRDVFNLTRELNPQIGKELTAIANITGLSQGIISVNQNLPEKIKKKISQAFLALRESPDGKQLLMLFQVNAVVPFRPEYLRAMEELFGEHQRLQARFARKAGPHQ